MHPLPNAAYFLALAPLVAWRIYSRVKRLTGRQRSVLWKHRATAILFSLGVLALALLAFATSLRALGGLAAGVTAGALLGHLSIAKTHFEQINDDEYYFTPHAPIGLLVAALFLGRLAWRGYTMLTAPSSQPGFMLTPLTLLTLGILAGYYTLFAYGLMAWRKRCTHAVPVPAQ